MPIAVIIIFVVLGVIIFRNKDKEHKSDIERLEKKIKNMPDNFKGMSLSEKSDYQAVLRESEKADKEWKHQNPLA